MRISCADIALACCLDRNHVCVDQSGEKQPRFFEQEAIQLVSLLRKNGGWMSEMPVYAFCPARKNPVPEATLGKLSQLGCVCVELSESELPAEFAFGDQFSVQLAAESHPAVEQKILMQLDLDVSILKPFPEEWFQEAAAGKFVLAYHDHPEGHVFDEAFLARLAATQKLGGICFNSYLQIWDKTRGYYKRLDAEIHSEAYREYFRKNVRSNYYFEEAIYDYCHLYGKFAGPERLLGISQIENRYFSHDHIEIRDFTTVR